jgi:putative DNA primase/helicase
MDINPDFNRHAGLLSSAVVQESISNLQESAKAGPVAHNEILNNLIEQIQPFDFYAAAFPEGSEKRKKLAECEAAMALADMEQYKAINEETKQIKRELQGKKLTEKHYLVQSIENLISLAQVNNWGLCKHLASIYLFNGSYWQEIDTEEFKKTLGEAAEKMGVERYSSRHFLFRDKLLSQFLSAAHLSPPECDANKVLINLKNGTFEIHAHGKTVLRPFDSLDFITYQLPFDHDPEAEAPIFKRYLNEVLPDQQSQRVLAEYLGYIFMRNGNDTLKEEKALVLYGSGANGKSVFFEIVNALFGAENISHYSLQNLTDESGYHRAKIANKLVNYASEINGKLESATFKQIVSGEQLQARLPYGQPFIMKQYAKLIFNCNELPKEVEQTNAFFRRFLIIPFNVTIPQERQDKNLHNKIITNELSGVFNWVLEGLQRLFEQRRFSECLAAEEALRQYKLESDSVQQFLAEAGYKTSEKKIPLKAVYSVYKTFCYDFGFRAASIQTFSKRLKNLGFEMSRQSDGMAVFAEVVF